MENELTEELYQRIFTLNEIISNLETENDDLKQDNEALKEMIEEMEKDMQENFRRIPIAEQYDIDDKDFI